jgi:Flp pilus assembly protein TadD
MTSRLQVLEQFLADDATDPFNHYAVGLEHVALRQYDAALAKFDDALTRDPRYIPAHHQRGLLFAQLGKRDEARKALLLGIESARAAGDAHAEHEMRDAINELE